jgi:hypothetical protein
VSSQLRVILPVFVDTSLSTVLDEKEIYKRERGSGYYNLLPYTLALLLVQLPVLAVLSLVYAGIGYWCADFHQRCYS